jgi:hypothetical protein
MLDLDTRNNNEPFWRASHEIEPVKLAAESGFNPAKAVEGMQPSAQPSGEERDFRDAWRDRPLDVVLQWFIRNSNLLRRAAIIERVENE